MEGLRNFIKVDNYCAVDVGDLKKGTRSSELRRPKCEGEGSEVSIREGPEESTLRTEEVRSKKSCINVEGQMRPLFVDADWHANCQAIYKGAEGRHWEELIVRSLHRKENGGPVLRGQMQNPKNESPLENEGSQGQRRRIL